MVLAVGQAASNSIRYCKDTLGGPTATIRIYLKKKKT